MQSFLFCPELFEIRQRLIDMMDRHEIYAFGDYAAVDVDFESFGIEITGIHTAKNAFTISMMVLQVAPEMRWGHRIWIEDSDNQGFRLFMCKHRMPPRSERWGSDENWDSEEGEDSDDE